jgi:hypothetical protein
VNGIQLANVLRRTIRKALLLFQLPADLLNTPKKGAMPGDVDGPVRAGSIVDIRRGGGGFSEALPDR